MGFALRWTLASAVGWAIGLAAFLIPPADREILQSMALVLAMGTTIGASQWLALRTKMRNAWWWVPVNVVGVGMGILLFNLLLGWLTDGWNIDGDNLDSTIPRWVLFGVLFGAVIGTTEAVVLRLDIARGLRWLGANSAGYAFGFGSFISLFYGLGFRGLFDFLPDRAQMAVVLVQCAILGLISGLPTGITLAWLFEKRREGQVNL